MQHGCLLIDGVFIGGPCDASVSKDVIRSPEDGSVVGAAAEGTHADLLHMLDSARVTCEDADTRAARLSVAAQRLNEEAEALATLLMRETGKPIAWARAEIDRCAVTFRLTAALGPRFLSPQAEDLGPDARARDYAATSRRVPRGPVLGIVPWNWPFNLAAHKIAPALAVGCPIVVKASPRAPLSTMALVRLVQESGEWEPGAIQVWNGSDSELRDISADPRWGVVSFTGSEQVGWSLAERVPRQTELILELGGDATVVVEGDEERAIPRIVWGGYGFAGQVCISVQHVRHASLPGFEERLAEEVRKVKIGPVDDPQTLIGPMINAESAARCWDWALESGGEILVGAPPEGNRLGPVLVKDPDPESRLATREVFGPIMTVSSFTDREAEIARLRAKPGSIQLGYFGPDPQPYVNGVPTGGWVVNDVPTVRFDALPYGGVGTSGLGGEGVRTSMVHYTRPRSMLVRLPE